ncbi:ATPase [Qipengyuania sediminis]|uniref:ATPase n=1 Tax=Qipengyuania sediminis TaxID=1532023 RepID=UPI0010598E84|nr:ATPase [Qipengyuania sediminis]
MSQIALPFAPLAGGPARIAVGEGNGSAVEALREPARWPFRTAVLIGPPRSGKSLFARWFEDSGAGTALDDADRAQEASVFHAWNRAQESGTPLLLTARPGWTVRLPDLASRLGGSLRLELTVPGDDLIADLIAAHAEQRRLVLGEGAATFLVPRIERSYAAVERVVAEIDRLSLERAVPATMSLWREAIDAVQGPEQGRLL